MSLPHGPRPPLIPAGASLLTLSVWGGCIGAQPHSAPRAPEGWWGRPWAGRGCVLRPTWVLIGHRDFRGERREG